VEAWTLRLIIVFAGALVLGLLYWQGTRQAGQQGRRVAQRPRDRQEPEIDTTAAAASRPDAHRMAVTGIDAELQAELERLSQEISEHRGQDFADHDFAHDHFGTDMPHVGHNGRKEPAIGALDPSDEVTDPMLSAAPAVATTQSRIRTEPEVVPLPPDSRVGARMQERIDRIVTVFVCAAEGDMLRGSDIVVAAEKTGLTFGHLGIFHSMIPGKPELGPIFSVASMVKPGHFDMRRIQELRTPGLTLFMALPGPMRALDAWDSMFPIANRLGELLGAQVLDEHRNALGRQRIQHLRDELRAYDREQDKNVIKRPW